MRVVSKNTIWAKGHVSGVLLNPKTNEQRKLFETNNIITYQAADIMAKLMGGQLEYKPNYMGFIYGTSATPGLNDPDAVGRLHTWSTIASDLAAVTGKANILIAPLASNPTYSVDGDGTLYTGNAITLIAQSGSRLEYGFSTTGTTYAAALQDDGSDYMFQAVLLTRIVQPSGILYLPFARVSLELPGGYPQKPTGWELALFWQVTYF